MDFDVIVAGAGPVGLMLACELKLAGVSVLVIERLSEPDLTSKAGAINVPTVEAFYRRGLLKELKGAQERNLASLKDYARLRQLHNPEMKELGKFAWHFSGMVLDPKKLILTDPEFSGRGPAGAGALVPQCEVEAILDARAMELDVDLRRGLEITGFDVLNDSVVVHTEHESFHTGWFVGCDGGRSMVRKGGGFDFIGTDAETTGHQAYVDIADPEKLEFGWTRTKKGVYTHGPRPGRILTMEFDKPLVDRNSSISLEDLEDSLRNASDTDVSLTGVRSNPTRFSDHARQSSTYRKGRLLLAGDSAHVHSPFGGQGLNLGVGDAMNLGWKLAAVVKGWTDDSLLDTYSTERHPIGAWVLNWTRAQMALMRTDEASVALSDLFEELIELPEVVTHLMKKIGGSWQRYDMPGDHPLIGRSAPDLELNDGRRLGDCLHDGRAVLFDLTKDQSFSDIVERWNDRVKHLPVQCSGRPELLALLVRSDGFVAWAADEVTETDGLEAALSQWLGVPAASRAALV